MQNLAVKTEDNRPREYLFNQCDRITQDPHFKQSELKLPNMLANIHSSSGYYLYILFI